MVVPFRWDIERREQLGRLVHGEPARWYPEFFDDLRAACSRVVALAGDCRLVFVGRSPESIFDYLSGVLGETTWKDRLALVNLSLKGIGDAGDPQAPGTRSAWAHLAAVGLEPEAIARAPVPIALIDLVYAGETFGKLVSMLLRRAEEQRTDPKAVLRRLRLVGITERRKNSPNTWRWQQQLEWTRLFRPSALKSVSIPAHMWNYLGNLQDKVVDSNPPRRWGMEDLAAPPRDPKRLAALRLAVQVFESASQADERRAFGAALARQPEVREKWLRALVHELKGVGG